MAESHSHFSCPQGRTSTVPFALWVGVESLGKALNLARVGDKAAVVHTGLRHLCPVEVNPFIRKTRATQEVHSTAVLGKLDSMQLEDGRPFVVYLNKPFDRTKVNVYKGGEK